MAHPGPRPAAQPAGAAAAAPHAAALPPRSDRCVVLHVCSCFLAQGLLHVLLDVEVRAIVTRVVLQPAKERRHKVKLRPCFQSLTSLRCTGCRHGGVCPPAGATKAEVTGGGGTATASCDVRLLASRSDVSISRAHYCRHDRQFPVRVLMA